MTCLSYEEWFCFCSRPDVFPTLKNNAGQDSEYDGDVESPELGDTITYFFSINNMGTTTLSQLEFGDTKVGRFIALSTAWTAHDCLFQHTQKNVLSASDSLVFHYYTE